MPGTFVTVGNSPLPFRRLLEAVEEIFEVLPKPIIAQHGHTQFTSAKVTLRPFVPPEEFTAQLRTAELIITHGGATAMLAAQLGKVPVVMPRLAAFREVIDDHQLHFATALASEGIVELATSTEELAQAAHRAIGRKRRRIAPGGNGLMKAIQALLEQEAAARATD